MKLNLRKSKGFTLVELLLVVGIIALGSVVAYITLPKVQATFRANAEATNINTIAAGVRNMYAGKNNFATLANTGVIINAKVAPEKMINSLGTGLVNGFGGSVTVGVEATALGSTAANKSYFITYGRVPDAECNKLASGVGNNFLKVTVNGISIKAAPGEGTLALNPANIAERCSNNDSNAMNFWGS